MNYIDDVSLYNKDDETVNIVVEICRGVSDKNELVEPGFNRLNRVREVVGIYPFHYGSFPQTFAGDDDPLDCIVFTDKTHNLLDLIKVDVIGAIKTIDAGYQDDKIICVESDCNLINVKKDLKRALKFLKYYKGYGADMVIEKKLATMEEANKLVEQAHEAWKENKKKQVQTPRQTTDRQKGRVRVIRR